MRAPRPLLVLALLAAALGVGRATPAAAQTASGRAELVDRIVAVVGMVPILASQVEEQLVLAKSQGAKIPDDSAGLEAARRQILSQMVDEELLVQQALRDTGIKVTEQEVQDEVEKTVQNVHKQFTAEQDFQTQLRAAGFASEEEWRRWLADNQRRTILQQRLIETLRQKNKLRPIPPTDAQMREFWDKNIAERPRHPPLISFRQLVIPVHPDSAAKAKAFALAESLLVAVRQGANFAEAAKKFSADSVSRAQGGELGWFRRGVMLKSFEDAAFHLRPGEIGGVVETAFGYHIIQVERVQPAEVEARHILIEPGISHDQVVLTRRLADSARTALAAGASFDTLARRYADPDAPRLVDGLPAPQLASDYPKTLATDSTLGWKPVFEIDTTGPRPKFVVLEVTKWQAAGDLTFADVKDRIRENLSQQLAVQHYLDLLRRTTYIDVRY
jgi:peptidyl-prolyl cis-trans isomerase SurA